jgi:mRNA interferase MazF
VNPGDVVLIHLPVLGQTGTKLRPALVLATLPGPYQNVLLCGISAQLQQPQQNWDEVLLPGDTDFGSSGVHLASTIRLSYLYAADVAEVIGAIGSIDSQRPIRLRNRIAGHLRP